MVKGFATYKAQQREYLMDLHPDLLSEIGLGKAGISRAYGTKDQGSTGKSIERKRAAMKLLTKKSFTPLFSGKKRQYPFSGSGKS